LGKKDFHEKMEKMRVVRSPFAADISFDECLRAIEGRREFRVTEKDGLRIVNYDFCFGATFPDPDGAATEEERRLLQIRRECRGIIFDAAGKLVCRRLHKFMNLGQTEETSSVALEERHVVCEKLDGCMISAMLVRGEPVLVSKNGPTELSERIVRCATGDWRGLARQWLGRGWTPTFEWVDPESPIVLKYARPELWLIAIREMSSGAYAPQRTVEAAAAEFGLACAPALWNSEKEGPLDLEKLRARIRDAKDSEGCVLKLEESGRWLKLKSDWYFAQSKSALQLPSSERQLWRLILDGTLDDLLPSLTSEVRASLEAFCRSLFERLAKTVDELVLPKALQLQREIEGSGRSWGAAVSAAYPTASFAKTLLFKAGTAEERAALLPLAATTLSKACVQPATFVSYRKELGLEDLNYL
jgi:T4 RnlA family RNA ligase